jgi:hypothetical protein
MIFSDDAPRVDWSEVRQLESTYGRKGGSSLAIPCAWTPAFALIPATQVHQANKTDNFTTVLGDDFIERIRGLSDPERKLILRSSVVGESIWDRGTYRSVVIDCEPDTFLNKFIKATSQVITSAKGGPISLMVQRFLQPTSRGEFGNLLCISKTRDHRELSSVDQSGSATKIRLNSQRDQAASPTPLPSPCGSKGESACIKPTSIWPPSRQSALCATLSAGFVVMNCPPAVGGAALGRGFEG